MTINRESGCAAHVPVFVCMDPVPWTLNDGDGASRRFKIGGWWPDASLRRPRTGTILGVNLTGDRLR